MAWYGAIVATFAFIWRLIEFFTTRPKIKVKVQRGRQILMGEDAGYDNKKTYVIIVAQNVGKGNVTIKNIGATYLRGGSMIAISHLNKGYQTIKEGASYDVPVEENLLDFSNIDSFIVWDAIDRVYTKPATNWFRRMWWRFRRFVKLV